MLTDPTLTPIPVISLRALEPEDLDFLYEMENDERAWSVSASRTHFSRFALRQYLAGQPADAFQSGELRQVIADGKVAVGLIDLTNFSPMDGRAEVCLLIHPAHRGKGYARAALGLLETYARQFLRIRMLYALISSRHNPISRQLFESAHYQPIATLPAWHNRGGEYEDVVLVQKFLDSPHGTGERT